jgi:hypothetical protein
MGFVVLDNLTYCTLKSIGRVKIKKLKEHLFFKKIKQILTFHKVKIKKKFNERLLVYKFNRLNYFIIYNLFRLYNLKSDLYLIKFLNKKFYKFFRKKIKKSIKIKHKNKAIFDNFFKNLPRSIVTLIKKKSLPKKLKRISFLKYVVPRFRSRGAMFWERRRLRVLDRRYLKRKLWSKRKIKFSSFYFKSDKKKLLNVHLNNFLIKMDLFSYLNSEFIKFFKFKVLFFNFFKIDKVFASNRKYVKALNFTNLKGGECSTSILLKKYKRVTSRLKFFINKYRRMSKIVVYRNNSYINLLTKGYYFSNSDSFLFQNHNNFNLVIYKKLFLYSTGRFLTYRFDRLLGCVVPVKYTKYTVLDKPRNASNFFKRFTKRLLTFTFKVNFFRRTEFNNVVSSDNFYIKNPANKLIISGKKKYGLNVYNNIFLVYNKIFKSHTVNQFEVANRVFRKLFIRGTVRSSGRIKDRKSSLKQDCHVLMRFSELKSRVNLFFLDTFNSICRKKDKNFRFKKMKDLIALEFLNLSFRKRSRIKKTQFYKLYLEINSFMFREFNFRGLFKFFRNRIFYGIQPRKRRFYYRNKRKFFTFRARRSLKAVRKKKLFKIYKSFLKKSQVPMQLFKYYEYINLRPYQRIKRYCRRRRRLIKIKKSKYVKRLKFNSRNFYKYRSKIYFFRKLKHIKDYQKAKKRYIRNPIRLRWGKIHTITSNFSNKLFINFLNNFNFTKKGINIATKARRNLLLKKKVPEYCFNNKFSYITNMKYINKFNRRLIIDLVTRPNSRKLMPNCHSRRTGFKRSKFKLLFYFLQKKIECKRIFSRYRFKANLNLLKEFPYTRFLKYSKKPFKNYKKRLVKRVNLLKIKCSNYIKIINKFLNFNKVIVLKFLIFFYLMKKFNIVKKHLKRKKK